MAEGGGKTPGGGRLETAKMSGEKAADAVIERPEGNQEIRKGEVQR